MALKKASRGAQYLKMSEFIFSFNDTGVDAVAGTTKGFGTTIAENLVMDIVNLPVGAIVHSGELLTEIQGVGPTAYTAAIGTSGGTALLAATTLLSAVGTKVAFTTTGITGNDGQNIRITMASTVAAATAGKFRVRVFWSLDNQVNENVTA